MESQLMAANNTVETIVCYAPTMITTNGIWQGDNPLDYSLPLFILQLSLVVITTRLLVYILKPFRQPRVISEILGVFASDSNISGSTVAATSFILESFWRSDIGPVGTWAQQSICQHCVPSTKCDGARNNGKHGSPVLPLPGWSRDGHVSNQKNWEKSHSHSHWRNDRALPYRPSLLFRSAQGFTEPEPGNFHTFPGSCPLCHRIPCACKSSGRDQTH
ncbi:CATION/H + ANTIPORTER [Salix purpurea]|uniref:CATION/H + ANTIPORTER n=1 Tax=Salix purpurea TaxID=77065 RepID=A0A9Q0V2K4_SALPP|nr:CATION/H + ANTIPORTER [Salix purpurea]